MSTRDAEPGADPAGPARPPWRRLAGLAGAVAGTIARHPRHLLLAALVAGLLAGPRWPAVVLAATVVAPLLARTPALALGVAAAVLAGAGFADVRLAALDRTALGPLLGGQTAARATLLDRPDRRPFGVRVAPARLRSGPGHGERVLLRAPPRVSWPRDAAPGVEVAVRGRMEPLRAFDAHERRRGGHAVLRVESLAATGRRRGGLLGALDRVRARAERALSTGVPPPQGALARGMVLGQDDALSERTREDFRTTGLAHLVAASGANVLLLATLVLALATAAGLGLTARLTLALVLVAAYVPLAGGGPSIQRAGIMGAAGLVAALAGRATSRWYALLLAAALTLALNPRAAEDPGWQLSFAAVLAMLAAVAPLRERLVRTRLPRGLAEVLAVTATATLGTAPLVALHFERLSLVSLPANVLAAPAVAPVMWLGTIAAALGQVAPPLAEPVARLAALPLGYLTWLAERGAALPGAELDLARGDVPALVATPAVGACAALAVLAALAAWRLRRGRWPGARPPAGRRGSGASRTTARRPRRGVARIATAVCVLAALGAGGLALRGPAAPDHLVISFLDVGQGDATLLQHRDTAVLVDTGPAEGPVLRRLREAGVRRLDLLVVTHDAADHGGATAEVLDRLPVGLLLDGEEDGGGATHRDPRAGAVPAVRDVAARHGVRRVATTAGQVVRAGPLALRVLWPERDAPAGPEADPNQRATVLHVRAGAFDLLLTADAESDVLAGLRAPRMDALKVAHHGSEDEGLPRLLERLRPAVATVSAGRRNTYGHPHPATLAALRAVPLVRRTDRDGTIRLHVRGGRMTVETER